MEVYQVFKMIFGLIASGFVLYFLISYAGVYSGISGCTQQSAAVKNYLKTAEDVYLTENEVDFPDFGRLHFTAEFEPWQTPPGLKIQGETNCGSIAVTVPIISRPGDSIALDGRTIDVGWWRYRMAVGLPDTLVVFAPLDSSPQTWEFMRDIAEAFPDTENTKTKVQFALCDGDDIDAGVCGSQGCSKSDFSGVLAATEGDVQGECSAKLPKDALLISVGVFCDQPDRGVCATPIGATTGEAYLANANKQFVTIDPLDVIALAAGGDEKTLFGVRGQRFYEYKQDSFLREARLAGSLAANRAFGMAEAIEDEIPDHDCVEALRAFAAAALAVSVAAQPDAYQTGGFNQLIESLGEAREAHENAADFGCDYVLT